MRKRRNAYFFRYFFLKHPLGGINHNLRGLIHVGGFLLLFLFFGCEIKKDVVSLEEKSLSLRSEKNTLLGSALYTPLKTFGDASFFGKISSLRVYGDRIYVSDATNNRVSIFNRDGGHIRNLSANKPFSVDVQGDVLWVGEKGGNNPSTIGLSRWNLSNFSSLGVFYLPTTARQVSVLGDIFFLPNGETLDVYNFNGDTFTRKDSIDVDGVPNKPVATYFSGSYLYVSDPSLNRVDIFESTYLSRFEYLGSLGEISDSHSPSHLRSPMGISALGNTLFIADRDAHRISVWQSDADSFTHLRNLGSSGPSGLAGNFSSPTHVEVDGERLFVADTGNHRISIWGIVCEEKKTGEKLNVASCFEN